MLPFRYTRILARAQKIIIKCAMLLHYTGTLGQMGTYSSRRPVAETMDELRRKPTADSRLAIVKLVVRLFGGEEGKKL